jgi:DNA recombination protein RmuC
MDVTALALLIVGLSLGTGVGVLVGRSSGANATASTTARLTSERDSLRAECERLTDDRARLEERAGVAERDLASVMATLVAERSAGTQRLAEFRAEQERVAEQFQALAAQALRHNNEVFLTLADERLKASQQAQVGELAKRAAEVQQLVDPIKETLGKVAQSILDTDQARVASHATLMESVRLSTVTSQQLQGQTQSLVRALQAPQARGAWGEMQLRRVVELAGMLEHCDFETQVSTTTADGLSRPDLVVNLAGGKHIVVDAKVSLKAFLDAAESDDPEVNVRRLEAHARHLRTHVDTLAAKAYWKQFSTAPEFVVLFVPGESFLVHALSHDPSLQEYAMERQVIIATPSLLIGLLRTVSYAWKQAALADNARTVFELGRELYDRLSVMGGHVDKLGRSIGSVVRDYNIAVGSLENRVLVSARKLKDIKFVDEDLDSPQMLDAGPRPLASPELLESAEREARLRVLPRSDAALMLELEIDDRYGVDAGGSGPSAGTLGA